jgi:glutathione S-transferase
MTITFYDIPSTLRPSQAWSPNTWKTRLSLNLKSIPYKTEWIEFPHIAALCHSKGISPTPSPWKGEGRRAPPYFSLPAILDTTPVIPTPVSDSLEIAKYLDASYPEIKQVLIPGGEAGEALQRKFTARFTELVYPPIAPIFFPKILDILNPASQAYFSQQRGRQVFGKTSLEEVTVPDRGEESRVWEEFRGAWNTLSKEFYKDQVEQLWFTGDEISFADLVVVGYLICFCLLFGEESWQWLDLRSWNGGRWGRMYDETAHLRIPHPIQQNALL